MVKVSFGLLFLFYLKILRFTICFFACSVLCVIPLCHYIIFSFTIVDIRTCYVLLAVVLCLLIAGLVQNLFSLSSSYSQIRYYLAYKYVTCFCVDFRTCYVLLAVVLCLLIAGLVLFFMIPRSVILLNDAPVLNHSFLQINTTKGYERVALTITVSNNYCSF